MDRERQAKSNAIGGGVHPRRAFGAEKLIAIGGAIEIDVVHEETRLHAELRHALDLFGPRDRTMLNPVHAGVGIGAINRLDRIERDVERLVAVAMDGDRPALRLDLGGHRLQLLAIEIRPALLRIVEIRNSLPALFVWFEPSPMIFIA